jgi:hypothetical protein
MTGCLCLQQKAKENKKGSNKKGQPGAGPRFFPNGELLELEDNAANEVCSVQIIVNVSVVAAKERIAVGLS